MRPWVPNERPGRRPGYQAAPPAPPPWPSARRPRGRTRAPGLRWAWRGQGNAPRRREPPTERDSSSSWRRRRDSASGVVQRGDTRQHLPLEELEGRTTAGGYMAHLVLETGLCHRGGGIATAHHRDRAPGRRVGHGPGDRESAMVERRCLEHPHRTVPYHGPGPGDPRREILLGRGIDVIHRPACRNLVARY